MNNCEPWYWEGNVQDALVRHLKASGWACDAVDTESRAHGIDVTATHATRGRLLVEVKGYPGTVYQRGPKKGQPKPTSPRLQGKHWFAAAAFAAMRHRCASGDAGVAIGLPDEELYRALLDDVWPALRKLDISVFLVDKHGNVRHLK